jgi:hypothetical protein
MKLITPPGMLLTVAVLAIYAAYAGWTAYVFRSWTFAAAAAVALVACIGTAMLRRWSRFIVYLLVAWLVGGWLWSVWDAQRAGYFAMFSPLQRFLSLAPGIVLTLLSLACAYTVFRHFRKGTAREVSG